MPVNTIQIQKLLGKHTFQQLRITVNELIDVVNGLPSTVRGDITRQGGVIDGNATGVLPTTNPGEFFVLNENWVGIGDFLGTDKPSTAIGHIHVNSLNSDARVNLSQNNASGVSYISFQAANSTAWAANNFGFVAATSNTTTEYGTIVLATANTGLEVSHIFERESWGWGNTADTDSATRLTLTSGENVGLAPHGGPTAHLAAQLRVDRALANDGQTTNTAPIISARGYSASYDGLGNNQVPVRIVIGDRNTDSETTANTYAALDFSANGADTTTEDSIGARISAEINREDDSTLGRSVSSSLEFSVRNGAGTLQKVMKVLPGGDITGNGGKSAVMISNTHFLDAATMRSTDFDGGLLYNNAQFGQLIVQQTAQSGFARQGILVRGNDDAGSGPATGTARIAMENPTARYTEGRKWDLRAEDTNSTSSKFEINTYPGDDWTGTANAQFSIQVSNSVTNFIFGNRPSEAGNGGPDNGTKLFISGGSAGEGSEIMMDTNYTTHDNNPGWVPTSWVIDNSGSGDFRVFPRNTDLFSDTGDITNDDSIFYLRKKDTANTLMGLGTRPDHSLQIRRTYESANVVVESTFGSVAGRNTATARVEARDQAGTENYAALNARNPNKSNYGNGSEGDAPLLLGLDPDNGDNVISVPRTAISIKHRDAVNRGSYPGKGLESRISFYNQTTGTNATGTADDNDGETWSSVNLVGSIGSDWESPGGARVSSFYGIDAAEANDYGAFRIELADAKTPDTKFHLNSEGHLGIGFTGTKAGQAFRPLGLYSPTYPLDISNIRMPGDDTANTLIAFSIAEATSLATSTDNSWLMGIDNFYTGVGKTDDAFVLTNTRVRALGQPKGLTVGGPEASLDSALSIERSTTSKATQIYQIGVREEHNTLTVYTPANTTSPNWDTSYAGRVGIGNTFPAHTLTVNGYNADSSGIGVYGAQAAIRFIDPEPTHPSYTWAGADLNGAATDPGGALAGAPLSERTYHIGSRNGSLVVAQQLGPNDTDIHDSAKAATLSVHANTGVETVSTGAAQSDGRINFTPGIGEEHLQNGSVGINANNVPLASGLFVGDYSKASENRRFVFQEQAYYPGTGSIRFLTAAGSYPTQVVLSGRPLSQANGAFKTVSVTAALTSNNADTSGTFEAGTGEILKRIQGVRRFSEGYIPGAGVTNPTTSRADANTVSWFDGIGVDDKFSVPAPAIGSEFLGTAASDTTPSSLQDESTKVWWERRAHQDNVGEGTDYQNREFSESHLFGSSNRHVMTVHSNTSYQGVHVEQGGIYANNSILAWARILPRGEDQNRLVAVDSRGTEETTAYTAVVKQSHNFETFTHVHRGLYQLTLPPEWQNGNNYAVMVTGTSNLIITNTTGSDLNQADDLSGSAATGGFTDAEYLNRTTRRAQAEVEQGDASGEGDVRSSVDLTTGNGVRPGGPHFYDVRVANSSIVQIESRVGLNVYDREATARHDDDEVFVVLVGAPDVTKFRG